MPEKQEPSSSNQYLWLFTIAAFGLGFWYLGSKISDLANQTHKVALAITIPELNDMIIRF